MIRTRKNSDVVEKIKYEIKWSVLDLIFDIKGNWYRMNMLDHMIKVLCEDSDVISSRLKQIIEDFNSGESVKLNKNDERWKTKDGYIGLEYTDLLKLKFKEWLGNYTKQTPYHFTSTDKKQAKEMLKFLESVGI